jgi:hypothetical protein
MMNLKKYRYAETAYEHDREIGADIVDFDLYVGNARLISKIYNGFQKSGVADPMYSEKPKFNFCKNYGLIVETVNGSEPEMRIISADVVLEYIVDDIVEFVRIVEEEVNHE